MAVTPTMIKEDIAPALASVSDARVERFIGYAKLRISESAYGSQYDLALAYLTAHMITVSNRDGGETQSETVGKISRTVAVAQINSDDPDLVSTVYGRAFKSIRKSSVITPFTL